jgi:hypothetical protein
MRSRTTGFLMAALAVGTFEGSASACHTCKKTPCVMVAPAPAMQCVTEMVPYTVYKQRTRMEFDLVPETIMVRVPQTTYVERQRCVNKPVWDTQYVQRQVNVCRPVSQTTMVTQQYTVCKPVSTTRQVTEVCMQPTTSLVTVPVVEKKCGHKVACGCATVAQTTFTPVSVVRDVVETQMVAETMSRQVPVTTTQMVNETKYETVPVRTCRIVPEIVTDRIPVTTFHCEPKTVTRRVPRPVCETVAEICYRRVERLVPVIYAAPAPAPSIQAPAPSTQAATSQQG